MKKEGFTLIEVSVCLFILLIIFSSTAYITCFGRNIICSIKIKSCVYETQGLLTYAKSYCSHNKKRGKIIIDYANNEISFKAYGTSILKKTEIKEGGTLCARQNNYSISEKGIKELMVSERGKIESGYTISLLEKDKCRRYDIAIRVGDDLINITEVNL